MVLRTSSVTSDFLLGTLKIISNTVPSDTQSSGHLSVRYFVFHNGIKWGKNLKFGPKSQDLSSLYINTLFNNV